MLLRSIGQRIVRRLHKKMIKYGCVVIIFCLCVLAICFLDYLLDQSSVVVEDTSKKNQLSRIKEQQRIATAFRKIANFPFLSTERKCEDLFENTRRNLSYSSYYWDHVDSYKNALSAAGVLKEGRTNEESWTIHEISKSPFVRNVCQTGFNGGHSAFMCLTANEHLKVYSFHDERHNHTKEMSTYVYWEFYERFIANVGDTRQTIPAFLADRPQFKCDMFVIDGSRSRYALQDDFRHISRLANPAGNIIVVELYTTNDAVKLWEEYKERGDVKEHFMCKFNELDVLSVRSSNHFGFAVGSYVNL